MASLDRVKNDKDFSLIEMFDNGGMRDAKSGSVSYPPAAGVAVDQDVQGSNAYDD